MTCVAGCGLTPGPSCNNIVCASGCPAPSSVGMSTLGGGSSSASTAGGYIPSGSSGYGINCAFGPCGGFNAGYTYAGGSGK